MSRVGTPRPLLRYGLNKSAARFSSRCGQSTAEGALTQNELVIHSIGTLSEARLGLVPLPKVDALTCAALVGGVRRRFMRHQCTACRREFFDDSGGLPES